MYLNCHTYYSMRYGTLSPQKLVEEAVERGIQALALTDINNTSCAYEFITACWQKEVKPILGITFRKNGKVLYTGLAQNREGFKELNTFLSKHSLEGKELPETAPDMPNTFIIYHRLVKTFDYFKKNEYLGIRPEHVNRLFGSVALDHPDKLVVLSPVVFPNKEWFHTHKLLRAIDLNTLLTKLTAKDCAKPSEIFYKPDVLAGFYSQYPFILENTKRVVDACSIDMKSSFANNRQTFTGSRSGDFQLLTKLAVAGCQKRYGPGDEKALDRVKKELQVIQKQHFCPYFLITWDVVRYAQSMGYHYVGRGSGANSIVAYCLRITDVDPLELDLYFERFINEFRTSPPDFDIDFSWDQRDEIQDYIIKRYGGDHTALLATYSRFKGKSIIRELGKVYGLPKEEIDKIVNDPLNVKEHHELARDIFQYGEKIEGFPNYLSIHAGGIVISEEPIYYHTALQAMPKGLPVTHFDMYHGEDLGYHKFDILSQRGLGHIKDAVELVHQNQGRSVDIYDVANIMKDEKVRAQLRSAQCIGCFYIESPAMRGLLSKLRCDNYRRLVAASSIIRPGVAQSGMMREYIRRFHEPHSFTYLHPTFEEHLGETFGVMVYQEDVMKIVHHFAGLELDESDVLRRVMSGKKAQGDTFEKLRQKYFANCRARGYSPELTQEVWRQVESFSGYSFCKAHSASYAVESFQSLYLKTYFPLEFIVGVINNFGGFYQTEYYFHEARVSGGGVHPPCVNYSEYLTTLKGNDLYVGFIHLYNMEHELAKRIVRERALRGEYRSLEEFVTRVPISPEQLDILIRIDAFRFTGKNKYELMWEKNAAYNPKEKFETAGRLFEPETTHYTLPDLQQGPYDQAFDEIALLGFPLCSPFDLLKDPDKYRSCILAKDLKYYINKQVQILGYYVCKKDVRTKNQKVMNFGTWLDPKGQYFDTTHFPESLRQYPLKGKGIYLLSGKVVEEFGFPSIEAGKVELVPYVGDERYGQDGVTAEGALQF